MLFSDGEDNASHTSIAEAVDICQHSHTAIYAFQPPPNSLGSSTGPGKLAALASQSGGRVFLQQDSPSVLTEDLRAIESDLRNQYRLVYKPAELKHDGSFHRIELSGPDRAATLAVRSGYYAPRQ